MKRDEHLAHSVEREHPYDFIVIGGGATGCGIALDAASRGFDVLLVEAQDFGSGTSSRSSKLVHGGVRYLAQGHVGLVYESLHERARMQRNAPHLVSVLPILVPAANRFELARFWIGLKIYDLLAGKASFGPSRFISRSKLRERMPEVADAGLAGAVEYFDGQFDDARLVIDLIKAAAEHGATPLNYCAVTQLNKNAEGRLQGVTLRDEASGRTFEVSGRVLINATGPYADSVVRLDDPDADRLITPSQGVHLAVARHFLPGDDGLLIPETPDGRIMFALPWHDHVILGTTDTQLDETPAQPLAQSDEIDLIIETVSRYLNPAPTHADILAVFAGVRPLPRGNTRKTAKLSREHSVSVSGSGLISITGGKWTTYRGMAEDCVDRAIAENKLSERPCRSADLPIGGVESESSQQDEFSAYGRDAAAIRQTIEREPRLAEPIHAELPYCAAHCLWAARKEMALTLEDILARRTRALFLNARAAIECAPQVAALVATEMGWDPERQAREVSELKANAAQYHSST